MADTSILHKRGIALESEGIISAMKYPFRADTVENFLTSAKYMN
jgi:hypothetical protein